MKLCDLLRERRKAAGITLRELGEATGIAYSHLSEIENGKRASAGNIGLLSAVRLSIALGVPVNVMAAAALEQATAQESGNG